MLIINGLNISYGELSVINEADLEFNLGLTSIIGKSGSGKSSILNVLAGQIKSDFVEFYYYTNELHNLSYEEYRNFARTNISYLVQGDNFIKDLTCYDNITLFAKLGGKVCSDQEIELILKKVGLKIDKKTYPDRLSGGEKQRLAVAQALAKDTPIILCDEITASLDEQNKKEIMKLLKTLAIENKKTIILTSHDENVHEQCDCIYKIEDGKVKVIKQNQKYNEKSKCFNNVSNKKLSFKDFMNYVSSKTDRQFTMFLIFSVICAFIIGLCTYITYYRYSYVTLQNDLMEVLTPTEITIVNQTVPNFNKAISSFMYNVANEPISEESASDMEKINHIENIYPYYLGISTENIISEGKIETLKIGDSKFEYYADSSYFNIVPYTPKENFDSVHQIIGRENVKSGAYINNMFIFNVLQMSVEEFLALDNYRITFDCYLPVAYFPEEGTAEFANDPTIIEYTSYSPVYQKETISIEIVGIIDPWYTETNSMQNIYLPIDVMEIARDQVTSTYMLKDGEITWSPNAYKVYVDDIANMEDVNNNLQQLDGNIATGSHYSNYQSRYEQQKYLKTVSLIALIIVLLTGCILAYAYGIYYYQKNISDINYFKRNGLTKKEFLTMLLSDICLQLEVVYILGACMSIGIFCITTNYGIHVAFKFFSVETIVLSIVLFIFAIIQCTITRYYYFKKVVMSHDKN